MLSTRNILEEKRRQREAIGASKKMSIKADFENTNPMMSLAKNRRDPKYARGKRILDKASILYDYLYPVALHSYSILVSCRAWANGSRNHRAV